MSQTPPPAMTVDMILTVVDELANVSTPTPGAMIVRYGLVTELRNELAPSLGATTRGAGGGGMPINAAALALWETITDRVLALREDLDGAPVRAGSLEQVLNAWARDLVAADQELTATYRAGLNQEALQLLHHRITRIRDLIENHFNPPRTGDIPDAQCPACGYTIAIVHDDDEGEQMQKPALGFHIDRNAAVTVSCRVPGCGATWRGWDELQLLRRQTRIFNIVFGHNEGDPR